MTAILDATFEPAIGQDVIIPGRIVGRTNWENGNVGFCVAFKKGGRTEQIWLRAEDMEIDDVG